MLESLVLKKGSFGQGIDSAVFVGIIFPDKSFLGSKRNIKLHFDSLFMKMAGQEKL
ncbi:MAG: hypothetical protein V3U87_09525 [Methylococcaceae bacterium]